MSRALRVAIAFLLVLAACGGGDDAADDPTTTAASAGDATTAAPTTSAPTTTTAAPPAVTVGNDFCGFLIEYAENGVVSPVGLSPAEVEAAFTANLDTMTQAAAIAPGEIQPDVEMFVVAYGGFVDFLGEYEWNFLAIPEDALNDPRLEALEDPELVAAGDRVEEFCGIENFIVSAPSDPGGGGGVVPGGGDVPDDFPAELVPDGGEVVSVVRVAGLSVTFNVVSSTDDVVAAYTDILGSPTQATPDGAVWVTQYQGATASVVVADTGDNMVQVNVTLI